MNVGNPNKLFYLSQGIQHRNYILCKMIQLSNVKRRYNFQERRNRQGKARPWQICMFSYELRTDIRRNLPWRGSWGCTSWQRQISLARLSLIPLPVLSIDGRIIFSVASSSGWVLRRRGTSMPVGSPVRAPCLCASVVILPRIFDGHFRVIVSHNRRRVRIV